MSKEKDDLKHLLYVCSACQKKQYVLVNKTLHLQREVLQSRGVANYIDIHPDEKNPGKEHGILLGIDEHFEVRSNRLIQPKSSNPSKSIASFLPPSPSSRRTYKIVDSEYQSFAWDNFKLFSDIHNLSFEIDNENSEEGGARVQLESPLEYIRADMTYYEKRLSEAHLSNAKEWLSIVLKWMELTTEINMEMVIPLILFIDHNHSTQPTLTDEMLISILLDKSAKIRLVDEKYRIKKADESIHEGNVTDEHAIYDLTGINVESINMISDHLGCCEFIPVNQLISDLMKGTQGDKYRNLATFVRIFYDLMHNNAIEYKVSYLQ